MQLWAVNASRVVVLSLHSTLHHRARNGDAAALVAVALYARRLFSHIALRFDNALDGSRNGTPGGAAVDGVWLVGHGVKEGGVW